MQVYCLDGVSAAKDSNRVVSVVTITTCV